MCYVESTYQYVAGMCVVCVWLEYGAGTEQVRVRHAVTSSRYEIGMVYVLILKLL